MSQARERSIASFVTLALVSVVTVLLASAGVLTYQSYATEQLHLVRARHRTLADQLAVGLASPLWNFDRPTLAKLADGALRDDMISGLVVRLDDDDSVIDARTRDGSWHVRETNREPQLEHGDLVEERAIVFGGEPIGRLKVTATTRFVERQLRTTGLYLILAIVVFDVLLVLALTVLLRRLVLGPLRRVERYALAVSQSSDSVRPEPPHGLEGELASLQGSLMRMIDQLQDAYVQLREWHHRLEITKDEERRLLSRELHDELGQTLTALKLRFKILATRGEPTLVKAIDDALILVDELIASVRKISVDLRPPLLDELGLEPALRAFLDSRAALSQTAIELTAEGLGERLTPAVEMACFRIVQEAVTNVLRHAGAQRARVTVTHAGNRLSIVVQDDGRGVSEEQAIARARAGHLGIVGMRERARALGGEIRFSSPPTTGEPHGTRIEVQLPTRVGES